MLLVALLPGAAPTADLTIAMDHVRSERGKLRVCITADPANFPDCDDDRQAIWRWTHAREPRLVIAGLPRGIYAVSVIHDENDNNRLDTFAGIPREGFGFSNNPAIGFGPPRFTVARFALDRDTQMQQVRIRYIF